MRNFFVDIINLSGLPKHKKKICNEGIFEIFGVGQKHFEKYYFWHITVKRSVRITLETSKSTFFMIFVFFGLFHIDISIVS